MNTIVRDKRAFDSLSPHAKINEYQMASRKVWTADRNGVIGAQPVKNSTFTLLNPPVRGQMPIAKELAAREKAVKT